MNGVKMQFHAYSSFKQVSTFNSNCMMDYKQLQPPPPQQQQQQPSPSIHHPYPEPLSPLKSCIRDYYQQLTPRWNNCFDRRVINNNNNNNINNINNNNNSPVITTNIETKCENDVAESYLNYNNNYSYSGENNFEQQKQLRTFQPCQQPFQPENFNETFDNVSNDFDDNNKNSNQSPPILQS